MEPSNSRYISTSDYPLFALKLITLRSDSQKTVLPTHTGAFLGELLWRNTNFGTLHLVAQLNQRQVDDRQKPVILDTILLDAGLNCLKLGHKCVVVFMLAVVVRYGR